MEDNTANLSGLYRYSRRIRVFLSSTFQDLQAERDYLVKKTFPAIQKIAEARNVDFSVVDLRWGVTEEEAHQGKVLEICFNEVEETRPFFIGLVGSRYGWCPDNKDIAQNQRLLNRYPQVEQFIAQGLSITHMEMEFGAFATKDPIHAHFYIRDNKRRMRDDEPEKLAALRERIAAQAEAGKCSAGHFSSPKDLGRQIYQSLLELLDSLYPANASDARQITADKQQYRLVRLQTIYHNKKALEQLESIVAKQQEPYMVVLKSAEGMGKSALAANFRKDDPTIIRTFLDEELNTALEALSHLETELQRRNLTIEQTTWIVDGLEYLTEEYDRTMDWLKDKRFRAHGLILTTRDTRLEQCAQAQAATAKRAYIAMEIPDVQAPDIRQITTDYLKHFAKGLQDAQLLKISLYPLFTNLKLLKLFLQEIVQFGSYEKLDEYIQSYLTAQSAEELITRVFERLERDYGVDYVTTFMGMLSLTKVGIPEDRLKWFVGMNSIDWSGFSGAVSQLITRNEKWVQLIPMVQEVAAKRYCHNDNQVRQWRKSLLRLYKRERLKLFLHGLREDFISTIAFSVLLGLPSDYSMLSSQITAEILLNELVLYGQRRTFRKYSLMTFSQAMLVRREMLHYYSTSMKTWIPLLPTFWVWTPSMWDTYLEQLCVSIVRGDKNEIKVLRDYVARKWWWPRGKRRKLLAKIDTYLQDDDDTPVEDTWATVDLDGFNTSKTIQWVLEDLIWIRSDKRIEHIYDESLKLYDRIEERHKKDPEYDTSPLLLVIYFIWSYMKYRQKKYDEAEEMLSKAMQLNPTASSGGLITFLVHLGAQNDKGCLEIIDETRNNMEGNTDEIIRKRFATTLYMTEMLYYNYKGDMQRIGEIIPKILNLYADNPEFNYGIRTNTAILLEIAGFNDAAAFLYTRAYEATEDENLQFDRIYDAAECSLRTQRYKDTRSIFKILLPFYQKRNETLNIVWAKSILSKTYSSEADYTVFRAKKRACYQQYVNLYQDIFKEDIDSEDNQFNYHVRRFNYAHTIGRAAVNYHIWRANHPVVQQAADVILSITDSPHITEEEYYYTCAYCMLAAKRYDWLEAHKERLSDKILHLYTFETTNPIDLSSIRPFVLSTLRRFEHVEPSETVYLIHGRAAGKLAEFCRHYWDEAFEYYWLPVLERIAKGEDEEEDTLHWQPAAMASLLLHAYAMEDRFQLASYQSAADTILADERLSDKDKNPLRAVMQCLKIIAQNNR